MKPKTLFQGGLAALLLLALPPAWSQQMNYQGRLTDANGNPLADGQQVLTFSFYDAATGGTQIWGPFIADGGAGNGRGPYATIVNGRFNTALGPLDTAGRALNTSFNGDRYLEIKIAGNSPITPRQKLLAAPLALKADIAATVVNGAIGTAQLADGSVTAAKLNSATGVWLTNPTGTYRDNGNGGVGIGNALPLNPANPTTLNPGTRLQVNSLQYGSAPTAIFESSNCGVPCDQPGWTETIRLWNSNSNGRTGIGFMSRASGAINAAPDVYAGTGDIAGSGSKDFRIATNVSGTLTDRLYLNGTTGILSIPGGVNTLKVDNGSNGGLIQVGANNTVLAARQVSFGDAGNVYIGESATTDDVMEIKGRAAIRMTGPVLMSGSGSGIPLEVTEFESQVFSYYAINYNSGGTLVSGFGNQTNVTIRAESGVQAGAMVLFSDARIKNVEGRSDAATDLGLLNRIEVTDYHYKDRVGRGPGAQKKVIAQQVEAVFPQAVQASTGVIPDIYKPAPCRDGWVEVANDLKPGERVKLITEKSGAGIHEVLEATPERFRTAFQPEGESQVFVFGREVKDFRSVDYDAIAMLNVSATQELARQVKEKDEKIATLESRLAALEKSVATLAALDRPAEPARKETARR